MLRKPLKVQKNLDEKWTIFKLKFAFMNYDPIFKKFGYG